MTIKYLHVFYKPNFHAQVLFFCKMSGESFFDFPLHLVRCICHLICLNIVLLTESDPAVPILIFCLLLDWFAITIYRSLKKNSNFRRLKTRKILDKTKMFAKHFIRRALQFHTLIYWKMSKRSKIIFDVQEDKFTFLHTQQDMQKHVSAVLTAMIIIDNKKPLLFADQKYLAKTYLQSHLPCRMRYLFQSRISIYQEKISFCRQAKMCEIQSISCK